MAGTQPGAQARPAGQPIGRRRRARLCKVLRKMAYPDSSQDVPPRANVARESDAPGAIEAATSRLLAALDALIHQCHEGDLPSRAHSTQALLVRDDDIGEIHLIELRFT